MDAFPLSIVQHGDTLCAKGAKYLVLQQYLFYWETNRSPKDIIKRIYTTEIEV